jgi:hypothetical protein
LLRAQRMPPPPHTHIRRVAPLALTARPISRPPARRAQVLTGLATPTLTHPTDVTVEPSVPRGTKGAPMTYLETYAPALVLEMLALVDLL